MASGTSYAGSYNGSCESSNGGEVCLYYNANYSGAVYDTLYSKPDYTGTYYGTNTSIDNSVSSSWNRDPDTTVWFFTYSNYTGFSLGLSGGGKQNWGSLGEDNTWSSHCFASNSTCPK
ncbi:peptidase inhibitor family I36 protein [Streptomyces sp. NPDC052107]|uniref:peptidase inhibitor family I36 protein n=1 Tax=Streptomyces sp. NPDC052107 TaxID=3155632 RepID=UPI003434C66C